MNAKQIKITDRIKKNYPKLGEWVDGLIDSTDNEDELPTNYGRFIDAVNEYKSVIEDERKDAEEDAENYNRQWQ